MFPPGLYLRKIEIFVIMRTQEQAKKERVGSCFALRSRRSKYLLISILFCIVLSGCNAGSASTQATLYSSSSSPTIGPRAFHATVTTFDGDFTLTLDVTPGCVCANVFLANVRDNQTGKPANQVIVTLYTTMREMAMGTDAVELHADGDGKFSATSTTLSMSGHWAIGITVTTADQRLHKAGVDLVVPL